MPVAASATSRLPSIVARPLGALGRLSRLIFEHAGEIGLLVGRSARAVATLRVAPRAVIQQMYVMGVQSVPIVLVAAILSGVVTSQQGGYQFQGSIPLYILGSVVTASIILELGPVLTAIVLVGRVGARITAELGTMKVSEQIDAYHALGRDPVAILAAPRILAGVIVLPLLVALANLVGVLAGMVAARLTVGLGFESFLYGARMFWHNWDLFYSLTKAVTFGFAIPVIAIHMGLRTRGGAAGVGSTTTAAVVFMLLTVLILDALFPPLLLQ
ncbi:MAG: ABC transporter permease [Gemmatimonadales bacterium]|nr:MAG: ABC transporter permease [Gemmatimonadales bacterium]